MNHKFAISWFKLTACQDVYLFINYRTKYNVSQLEWSEIREKIKKNVGKIA